jgi:hypothetical protein
MSRCATRLARLRANSRWTMVTSGWRGSRRLLLALNVSAGTARFWQLSEALRKHMLVASSSDRDPKPTVGPKCSGHQQTVSLCACRLRRILGTYTCSRGASPRAYNESVLLKTVPSRSCGMG